MTPIHTTIMRCSSLQSILLSLAGGIAATGCGPSRPPRLAAPALNPAAEVPGVNCGLYRVELTGPGIDGRPLPASFNTESRLGLAVGAALPPNGMATFDLK